MILQVPAALSRWCFSRTSLLVGPMWSFPTIHQALSLLHWWSTALGSRAECLSPVPWSDIPLPIRYTPQWPWDETKRSQDQSPHDTYSRGSRFDRNKIVKGRGFIRDNGITWNCSWQQKLHRNTILKTYIMIYCRNIIIEYWTLKVCWECDTCSRHLLFYLHLRHSGEWCDLELESK